MVDPIRHANDRNFIESILRYVPGFRGYLEQEYRRESDFLLRTWLADKLHGGKKGLDEFLLKLVSAMKLDDLPQFERVRSKLDGLIGKIRSAERGYSAAFAYVRIREDELDSIYQLDKGLVAEAETLAGALDQLGGADPQRAGELATNLVRQIDEFDKRFGQRVELLRGVN